MNKVVIMTLITILSSSAAIAEEFKLYKYRDHQGNYSIGTNLPFEYARYGYTILDNNRKVLKTVPRQLTEDEIKELKKNRVAQLANEYSAEEQYRRDISLLKLYQTSEDIEFAKGRNIDQLNEKIKYQEDMIQGLVFKKENIELSALKYEYLGKKINRNLLSSLKQIRAEISIQKSGIVALKKQIVTSLRLYEADEKRYLEIQQR